MLPPPYFTTEIMFSCWFVVPFLHHAQCFKQFGFTFFSPQTFFSVSSELHDSVHCLQTVAGLIMRTTAAYSLNCVVHFSQILSYNTVTSLFPICWLVSRLLEVVTSVSPLQHTEHSTKRQWIQLQCIHGQKWDKWSQCTQAGHAQYHTFRKPSRHLSLTLSLHGVPKSLSKLT